LAIKVQVQALTENSFFIQVPEGKKVAKVMADTVAFSRAFGVEVLEAHVQGNGFTLQVLNEGNIYSAVQGAATQAFEEPIDEEEH